MASGSPKPRAWKSAATISAIESLGLVERQRHRLAGAPQLAGDEMVLRREPGARIGEEDQAVGLGDRALGLRAHLRLDARPGSRPGRRCRSPRRAPAPGAPKPYWRSRVSPGHVGHDGIARAGEHVEQRRLADVRPADERDDGQHGTWREALARLAQPSGAVAESVLLAVALDLLARCCQRVTR